MIMGDFGDDVMMRERPVKCVHGPNGDRVALFVCQRVDPREMSIIRLHWCCPAQAEGSSLRLVLVW